MPEETLEQAFESFSRTSRGEAGERLAFFAGAVVAGSIIARGQQGRPDLLAEYLRESEEAAREFAEWKTVLRTQVG